MTIRIVGPLFYLCLFFKYFYPLHESIVHINWFLFFYEIIGWVALLAVLFYITLVRFADISTVETKRVGKLLIKSCENFEKKRKKLLTKLYFWLFTIPTIVFVGFFVKDYSLFILMVSLNLASRYFIYQIHLLVEKVKLRVVKNCKVIL